MLYHTAWHERNKPIKTLLKQFLDKKSGRVSQARCELKRRFEYQDWNVQKQIMNAFLQSGKTDRDWAYSKVYRHWDDSFAGVIMELWQKFHEPKCSWSAILSLPKDYIVEHIDEFTYDRNYFFIALRFGGDSDFEIDRSKLSAEDYLYVIAQTGRSMDISEAVDVFFMTLHDRCIMRNFTGKEIDCISENLSRDGVCSSLAVVNGDSILDSMLIVCEKQEQALSAYEKVKAWNHQIMNTIYNSPDFEYLKQSQFQGAAYNDKRLYVCLKYFYKEMPDKYKSTTDYKFVDNVEDIPLIREYYHIYQDNEHLPF